MPNALIVLLILTLFTWTFMGHTSSHFFHKSHSCYFQVLMCFSVSKFCIWISFLRIEKLQYIRCAQIRSTRLPDEWRSTAAPNTLEPSLNCFLSPFWGLEFWSGSRISGKHLHLSITSFLIVIFSYIILLTLLHIHWMQSNFMLTAGKCMKFIFKSAYFVVIANFTNRSLVHICDFPYKKSTSWEFL